MHLSEKGDSLEDARTRVLNNTVKDATRRDREVTGVARRHQD